MTTQTLEEKYLFYKKGYEDCIRRSNNNPLYKAEWLIEAENWKYKANQIVMENPDLQLERIP